MSISHTHHSSGLSVTVRDLEGHPGESRDLRLDVRAPGGLKGEMIGVPDDGRLEVDGLLESVHEGILASGSARVPLEGECSRCLDPIAQELEVEFRELFAYSVVDTDDCAVEDGHIDLEPVIRDAIVLALPFQPVCREDCPGLCPQCGAHLVDDPAHTHGPQVDGRWSALGGMRFDTE